MKRCETSWPSRELALFIDLLLAGLEALASPFPLSSDLGVEFPPGWGEEDKDQVVSGLNV